MYSSRFYVLSSIVYEILDELKHEAEKRLETIKSIVNCYYTKGLITEEEQEELFDLIDFESSFLQLVGE